MNKFFSIFLSFLSVSTLVGSSQYQPISLQRPDKSTCHYYFDPSQVQGDFSIVLLLQGSETESPITNGYITTPNKSWLKKNNCVVLVVEKAGVTPGNLDEKEYFKLNTLTQRAHDCQMVLDHIKKTNPDWNKKLVIFGGSEGGVLAAYLTSRLSEAVATVIFSGGCGMTLRDEILLLEKKAAQAGVIGSCKYYSKAAYLGAMFSLAKYLSNSPRTFYGETNTFKWWNSIVDYNPLDTLKNYDKPLYLVHGTADTNCPVESADKLADAFQKLGKTNLLYKRYDGYDHCFNDQTGDNHFDEVTGRALEWAAEFLHQ